MLFENILFLHVTDAFIDDTLGAGGGTVHSTVDRTDGRVEGKRCIRTGVTK